MTSCARKLSFIATALCFSAACMASQEGLADDPAAGDLHRWSVRPGIELGTQVAGERNLFWDLPYKVPEGAGFDPDRHWWEFYVKPSVALNYALGEQSAWYARLSAVGSGTLRHDAFDAGNTGRLGLEEAVLGLQLPLSPGGPQLDLSAGAQTFTLGTGMLISNGASNGFSRGALKLGPRKAFRETAIARLRTDSVTGEMFYLVPNENPDSSSGNRLAGAAVTYRPGSDEQAGLAYGRVLRSTAAYPQAAPGGVGVPSIIPNARADLQFLYAFARRPLWENAQSKGWAAVDLAHEWNNRQPLSAWGGRVEVGVALPTLRWKPTVTLGYQSFSGDNPHTSRNERFDPLYYEGSPGAWATGSKSSMVFINTNANALQATIALHLTERDTLTWYVAHIRANQLGSPLQFGQGTRLEVIQNTPVILAGVTTPHLSNDLFIKYMRVVNRNTYLTAGFSASFPGAGMKQLAGPQAPIWTGWFVNVVLAY